MLLIKYWKKMRVGKAMFKLLLYFMVESFRVIGKLVPMLVSPILLLTKHLLVDSPPLPLSVMLMNLAQSKQVLLSQ